VAESLSDKVVWITGGGTGLGKYLAVELARRGCDVAVSGRRADRLDEAVSAIRATGRRAWAIACDVTDDESVARAVAQVVREAGRLDIAVANAGFGVAGRIENLTAADWRRQFETNVVGLGSTVYHALPELKKTQGRVVLIGSVAGLVCSPGVGAYHASKYAVRAIGQTLSMELSGSGVSCTTIHPGFVESEIAQVDNQGVYRPELTDKRPAKLMWKTEPAARVMADAIASREREYVFTWHGKFAGFVGRHAPGLVHAILSRSASSYRRR
jgi:NAD(P)-dependent dehydrogenase (short-subunit alcohol dehydrogenase family)